MKKVFLLLLLIPCSLSAQNGSGYSNPQSVTTAAGNTWYVLNRAGDYSNNEVECYNQSQVGFAANALTITTATGTYSCGDYDHTASNHSVLSGMVQTATKNFTFGDFQAKIEFPSGWPAFWLLGANCQPSNSVTADSITYGGKTCNWNSDADDSGELDIAEVKTGSLGDTAVLQNNCTNNNTCGYSNEVKVSNVTTNYHVYEMIWTTNSVTWYIDGTAGGSTTSNIPQNPLFIIFNAAASSANGSPNNGQVMTVQWVKHCPSTCANNTSSTDANADFVDTFGSATAPTTATGITAVVK
jgi:beta-glucanase (GH16 family)